MEDYITPERIANSILQDVDFSGYYVLLEGKKDIKVYVKLLSKESIRPKVTFGKHKLRAVYNILERRGFVRKFGIRDADFLRLAGNEKYQSEFNMAIFVTDYHDSEVMMLSVGVLEDLCTLVADNDKIKSMENRLAGSFAELLLKTLYPLGCLKLANKRFSLGLAFKPQKPEGNRLRIDKFISGRDFSFLGNKEMINTVYEYSKNRGGNVSSREIIDDKLQIIIKENHPIMEIVHGHDISELISLIFKENIKINDKNFHSADHIENLMASNFDWMKFTTTNLYKQIRLWQTQQNVNILRYDTE